MTPDLINLDDDGAKELVIQLLARLDEAKTAVETSQRRAAGIRKMLDGLVEMFPAAEDVLPEDFDEDRPPRPRGAEAVRRVLADAVDRWYTVPGVVEQLAKRGWMPNSTNPANAVRTALERLVDNRLCEKGRSTDGLVIYSIPSRHPLDEEPF